MTHNQDIVAARVKALERQVRALQAVAVGALMLAALVGLTARPGAQQASIDPLRVRQLVVEDAAGRARLVLGPLDPPPSTRGVGLRINDVNGIERFGLSLRDNGSVAMGFDAPPGTGDDRNRERINIGADEMGSAYLRFLDRRTNVIARMYLDEQNRAWMQFSDFTQTPPVIRRYGLTGEETIRPTR